MTSPKVARALAALEFHAYHVGGEGQPPFGSEDEVVLEHAHRCNQIIVTNNYDLIMLCAEHNESVLWLDPRGPDLTLREIVLRCFEGVEVWQQLFEAAEGPICVRSLKTKDETMTLERAFELARKRLAQKTRRDREHARRGALKMSSNPPL